MSAKSAEQLEKVTAELAALKAEYEEFVYIVSHDLSAPLRQIEGFSEMVMSKPSNNIEDKTQRHLDLIHQGAKQATLMLNALTTYSRLNTRAKPFVLFDTNKTLADAMSNLSNLISDTKASITCTNLPTIIGESEQIQLLFECLIENALIYRQPENKPIISISASEKGDFWQFYIRDNGIGVPENVKEKIFKVLRRGVSNKKYPGLGMGLAITKKILQKHQGDISLVLETDIGSTFYFTIAKDLPYE